MIINRIYVQMDDIKGWHTALYYDRTSANQYFADVRKKHPNAYVITEKIDDNTGTIIKRNEYNKPVDVDIDEVKSLRQEYVSIYKYNIEWKEETLVEENIHPKVASNYMIEAAGSDGYGTKWIYIIKPCCFVKHINFIDSITDNKGRYLSLMHLY